MSKSPKLNFLQGQDSEQDMFDNMINVPRDDYKPTVTANRVHMSLKLIRLLRGGLGSSKTRTACEHINNMALKYPGSTYLVGRKDITSLKVTTQVEYLEKVVSPETVDSFNVNDGILYYKNRSKTMFRETKEPDKVKSLELSGWLIDEADELPDTEMEEKLTQRLRQKIRMNGKWVIPPYAGLLVFNPVDDLHWLYFLAHKGWNKDEASEKDVRKYLNKMNLEDFRFDTYENKQNLPPTYIPNLIDNTPPEDLDRLIHGHWGRAIHGKPVINNFTIKKNVRSLNLIEHLPLLVGWDFGYNHPAVSFIQIDPLTTRVFLLREILGNKIYLEDFVEEYKTLKKSLVPLGFSIKHYGDPHGEDQRDVGEGSIEYLRVHHNIIVNTRRQKIKTGLDEIQHRVNSIAPLDYNNPNIKESLFLVDHSCKISIKGYQGYYQRDKFGEPIKDGYYDHTPDTHRYVIVNNKNEGLANRFKGKKRKPRNRVTGY